MDIWIKIRSLFDKQAVDDAAKGVEDVGKKTEAVGEAARGAQGNTDKAFSAINASAQVAEGGVAGVGNAVRTLAGQFPALNAAIAPVGLALAAFAAWKKAVDAVKDARHGLERSLVETKLGNEEAAVRSLADAYARMQEEINKAAAARKLEQDAAQARDDAQLAADLAQIELDAAVSASKLNPSDPFAKRRLDVETARRRAAASDAAASRKLDRELSGMQAEGSELERTKQAAAGQQRDIEAAVAAIMGQISDRQQKAASDEAKISRNLPGGAARRKAVWDQADADIKRLVADLKDYTSQFKDAAAAALAAEQRQYSLSQNVDVNMLQRRALSSSSRATGFGLDRDASQIERDAAAERERLQLRLRELMDRQADEADRGGDLRARRAAESADVARVRRTGKGNLEKEQKEFEAAAKALADYAERSTRVLADLRADMAKVKEALRNLPNN